MHAPLSLFNIYKDSSVHSLKYSNSYRYSRKYRLMPSKTNFLRYYNLYAVMISPLTQLRLSSHFRKEYHTLMKLPTHTDDKDILTHHHSSCAGTLMYWPSIKSLKAYSTNLKFVLTHWQLKYVTDSNPLHSVVSGGFYSGGINDVIIPREDILQFLV